MNHIKILSMLLFLTIGPAAYATNPIEKSDEGPLLTEPVIPGTRVPLEKLNTAPNEPQLQQEEKESRFILEEKIRRKNGKRQSQEKE